MDEPTEHYAKWNKMGRERQILYGFTYMLKLKNKTNQQNKIATDSSAENKLMVDQGDEGEGNGWGGEGINKYK